MNRKGAFVLVPLVLLLLCVAAYLAFFVPQGLEDRGRTSFSASFDFHSYFLPRFILDAREFRSGSVPLWNRYEYGGIPLLATTQPAALYPPTALFYSWFGPVTAHWVWLAFHYALLVVTFLWFLREEGITGLPAFAGTAAWVFQTLVLSSNYSPIRIANVVFIPLVLIFANRIARGSFGAFALLAVALAVQLTTGYPEFFFDEALIVVVHAVVSFATKRWSLPPYKSIPLLGAAFLLGALVAAAQIVPLGELALESHRAQLADAAHMLPVVWGQWLIRFAPGLFVFVVIAFFLRSARVPIAGLVFCWFMSQWGWLLLRSLPGFGYIRFPIVWLFFAAVFTAWMAALTLKELAVAPASVPTDGATSAFSERGRRIALLVVALGSLAFAALYAFNATKFASGSPSAEPPSTEFNRYLGTKLAAGLGIAGSLGLAGAALLALRGKTLPVVWYAALTVLVVAHNAAYPFGVAPAPFKRPGRHGTAATLHGNPARIQGRVLSLDDILYGYEITDKLPSPVGIEFSFLPWRARRLLDALHFLPVFGTIDWVKTVEAKGFLAAMDVEYVAGDALLAQLFEQNGLVPVRKIGTSMLFENPGRMGHAWVNYAVKRIEDPETSLAHVLSREFDPRRVVVLEEAPSATYPERTDDAVTAPRAERRFSSSDVEFDVDVPRPGVFVVSESAYPGWQATVDGQPARWLTADYFFKAVELGPGRHTVRFAYRPGSFRLGLALSGLGLVIVGAIVAAGRRRARRAGAAA